MRTTQYPGELQPLIRWAINRNAATITQEPPEPFRTWIKAQMPPYAQHKIEYWVGLITSESRLDGDWVDGYPHTHVQSVGWHPSAITAMTYLVAPDLGGEIGVGGKKETDPYEFTLPTPGLTVIVDAETWHGVKPVISGTRVALISTGKAL